MVQDIIEIFRDHQQRRAHQNGIHLKPISFYLEVQVSQAKSAHQNGFDSKQCSRAYQTIIAKQRNSQNLTFEVLQNFYKFGPGEIYTEQIRKQYRLDVWKHRLRHNLPEFPPIESNETKKPLKPRSFSKHGTKLNIEMTTNETFNTKYQEHRNHSVSASTKRHLRLLS